MTGVAGGQESQGQWIVAAVAGLNDVEELSAGSFGTVSTPVPGGRIDGVVMRDDSVRVGVVARLGRPLPEIAADVHDTVQALVPDRRVHVSIEDITLDSAGASVPRPR